MVTEQTKSFSNWRQEPSRGGHSNNYPNKAYIMRTVCFLCLTASLFRAGISTDIERSRSFARTLRQSSHRWWTAKYDNAPQFSGREKPGRGLQPSLLSQSVPDLLSQSRHEDLLEQPRSRPVRAGSLSTK